MNEELAVGSMGQSSENAVYTRDFVNGLLASFGECGGPEGLTLNDDGACHLEDGSGRIVTILHVEPAPLLTLFVKLSLPQTIPHDLKLQMLKANGDPSITMGGLIATLEQGGPLHFLYRLPISRMDAETLLSLIRLFADLANSLEVEFAVSDPGAHSEIAPLAQRV